MRKMSKQLSVWLYAQNLRDFINNDVKVIITNTEFLFVSKKEDYTFMKVRYNCILRKEKLDHVEIYETWDEIFNQIINLRDTDEKI